MKKLTLDQKLHKKKIKKPGFVYNMLGGVWKMLFMKKYGIKVFDKIDLKHKKGPYILVSNHASRLDYIYVGLPLLPNRLNFVAGYNEFFRSHLKGVFSILKVIPKKNFTADIYTIKQISRVLKQNGKIVIFPEGMNSISGANQPVALGTGKFIKHFKVPVYFALIKGGYLTSPKYSLEERTGRVEVTFDELFKIEDIEKLTPEQIEDKMNEALYHDDYLWNKTHQYKYKTNGNVANNLSDLLFICPKCKQEFTMVSSKNKIKCSACSNEAIIDDAYNLIFQNDSYFPPTQTEWFNMQREIIKEQVKDPTFSYQVEVELGLLDDFKPIKNKQTSNIVGKGQITLNHQGLTFDGIKNEEKFSFHIKSQDLPTYGMCTDISRFYTFFEGKFYEFYPLERCVEKCFLVTEEIHRLNGGKWQDFKFKK